MLSKCANPECSEQFRYLHQGRLFHLSPIPELHLHEEACRRLYERFWLCDQCCKSLTVIWDGLQAKIIHLPPITKARTPSDSEDWAALESIGGSFAGQQTAENPLGVDHLLSSESGLDCDEATQKDAMQVAVNIAETTVCTAGAECTLPHSRTSETSGSSIEEANRGGFEAAGRNCSPSHSDHD